MIIPLNIEGEDIDIYVVKTNDQDYRKLAMALIENLATEQLNNLFNMRNNKKFILYSDLLRCYQLKGYLFKQSCKCVCGVNIEYPYVIMNVNTQEELIVGSVCKDNWDTNDCISYYCKYCKRKKSNMKDCSDCQGKKDLRLLFHTWKTFLSDKVDFGKYRGKSYYRLTNDKSYCDWIVSEFKDNDKRKLKVLKYLN